MALWTAAAAAGATGGSTSGSWCVDGISIDTRTLKQNDLFVALPGTQTDGHAFLDAAFAAGAAAALVRPRPVSTPCYLEVPDPLQALRALGHAARDRTAARIVAVTGSVGKTGTKELLRAALAPLGPVHASSASHNNAIGVPLSLARMPAGTAAGVFELGMSHAGEIGELVRTVRPHVAVITRIAPAHLENFEGVEQIAAAKGEIFEGLEPGGSAVVPGDSPGVDVLLAAAGESQADRIVTFGTGASSDARLLDTTPDATGQTFRWRFEGRTHAGRLRLHGTHWAMNAVAAAVAATLLGVAPDAATEHLRTVPHLAGRGRRHTVEVAGGQAWVIDDSYNANPASMRAALATLKAMPATGRRLAVLGEMKELGAASSELHAGLAPAVRGIDRVWCVGREMAPLQRILPSGITGELVSDAETAAEQALAELQAGDVLLVKGSRATGLDIVVARAAGQDPG